MKHKYRLAAIDLDGTTLRGDKTIGARTLQTVNAAMAGGTEIIIATGRSRIQFQRYAEQFPAMKYAISSSGAAVYDLQREWKKVLSNEIPPEICLQILEYAAGVDCFPILSVEGKSYYPARMREQAAEYGLAAYEYEMNAFGTGVEDIFAWYQTALKPAESISLYYREEVLRHKAVKAFAHLPLYFALPGEPGVEISMETANKGYALEQLCDILQIPVCDTIAIGDSDNDLPMLRKAGLAIASGNAPAHVKAEADFVTADCEHDGVAVALERYIL